jgi:hypothetical protein
MRTFRRHGERIRMQLEPIEVDLLRNTRDGVRAALAGGDVTDPIVQRLFPRTLDDDDEGDAELRRLLHDDLLAARLAGLDALVDVLDRGTPHRGHLRVDLRDDEPLLVLGVLNDLRLAIGARIGIEDLDRREVAEDDPVSYRLAVMDHLAGMQEQLLAILDPPSVSVHRDLRPEDLE